MTETPTTTLTEHAMLVIWGAFAHKIGLVEAIESVKVPQRRRDHTPQSKLIEFLVAILGGCQYLQDISQGPHPLDLDEEAARAWGQDKWADYSGVSRTLKACTLATVAEIRQALDEVSQPFIDREVKLAMQERGVIVYDGDLTGRPVSNTSTSYPGAAFGWMSDEIGLGYQLALVSMHSPTYGRLWLSGEHHPGDTVSNSQAEALVRAAEARTGVRPLRRTALLWERIDAHKLRLNEARNKLEQRLEKAEGAVATCRSVEEELEIWKVQANELEKEYERCGKKVRPYSKLAKARDKVRIYRDRLERRRKDVAHATRLLEKEKVRFQSVRAEMDVLEERLSEFEKDNHANPSPIRAIIRLDAGFGSGENVALLIEMGYEVYSKPTSYQVTKELRKLVDDDTVWFRVGKNAEVVTWTQKSIKNCPYPLDLALERFYTGDKLRHSTLLHFGTDDVTSDPEGWFSFYNGRQTIEAGIKECKSVFHLKHMHVRSESGILIQELFALFVANFVRWAAHWLNQSHPDDESPLTSERPRVKELVRVAANTSARVTRHPDGGCEVVFTELSPYFGIRVVTSSRRASGLSVVLESLRLLKLRIFPRNHRFRLWLHKC